VIRAKLGLLELAKPYCQQPWIPSRKVAARFLGYRLPAAATRLGELPRPGSSISGRELLFYTEDHRLRLSSPWGHATPNRIR